MGHSEPIFETEQVDYFCEQRLTAIAVDGLEMGHRPDTLTARWLSLSRSLFVPESRRISFEPHTRRTTYTLMKVIIANSNLLWSRRLEKTIQSLGHSLAIISSKGSQTPKGDLAIVNLAEISFSPFEMIRTLRDAGIPVIAFAGHKEKELWKRAKEAGADRIVSNGEITFKLSNILSEFVHAG